MTASATADRTAPISQKANYRAYPKPRMTD
jgi:hypothetical protein